MPDNPLYAAAPREYRIVTDPGLAALHSEERRRDAWRELGRARRSFRRQLRTGPKDAA